MENDSDEKKTEAISRERNGAKRSSDTCLFWLAKKKRCCLTKPQDGSSYCLSHINKLQNSDDSIQNETETGIINSNQDLKTEKEIQIVPSNSEKLDNRSDLNLNHCHYWIERKKRYCKAAFLAGNVYCAEHLVEIKSDNDRPRIRCPNDPRHSCYADQLERHLKRCNAREQLRPVFYVKGINSGEGDEDKLSIHDIEINEVFSLIDRISSLHRDHVQNISDSIENHPVLHEALQDPTKGAVAQKHLRQQASLVGNLERLGLLHNGISYIEFGAGKGGLSHWVQLANKNSTNTRYLLIDKSSVRYKMDSYHKGVDQGPDFERLKINIEDLDLDRVPSLSSANCPLVGIGKHLCGGATDMMLRCMTESIQKAPTLKVEGIVLALCCHHRCDWKSYVGKQWFTDRGLDARFFKLVTSMSAWSTCGSRLNTDVSDKDDSHIPNKMEYNHPRYGSLLPEERERIGFQCKRLIDAGRIEFLEKFGFIAKIVHYTDTKTTLENTAILAVMPNNNGQNDPDDTTVGDSHSIELN